MYCLSSSAVTPRAMRLMGSVSKQRDCLNLSAPVSPAVSPSVVVVMSIGFLVCLSFGNAREGRKCLFHLGLDGFHQPPAQVQDATDEFVLMRRWNDFNRC